MDEKTKRINDGFALGWKDFCEVRKQRNLTEYHADFRYGYNVGYFAAADEERLMEPDWEGII